MEISISVWCGITNIYISVTKLIILSSFIFGDKNSLRLVVSVLNKILFIQPKDILYIFFKNLT